MKSKTKAKSLIELKMSDTRYRDQFEKDHIFFKIEVQLLLALERRGLTYEQLAKELHTSKGNISRDLQGGISSAKLGRIQRMADALGLVFIPVMLPKGKLQAFLPKLERLVAA